MIKEKHFGKMYVAIQCTWKQDLLCDCPKEKNMTFYTVSSYNFVGKFTLKKSALDSFNSKSLCVGEIVT